MKKPLKLLGMIVLLFFVYQFIVLLFINQFSTSYKRVVKNEVFQVQEEFQIINGKHVYSFELSNQKQQTYHFQVYENYNKQREILDKIEWFEQGDISCIYPVLKDKRPSEMVCQKKQKEVSFSYLLEKEEAWIKKVLNQLDKRGYQNPAWNLENELKTYKKISYYPKNIGENQVFSFWNYQGVYLLAKNSKIKDKKLFKIDKYENDKSILVEDILLVIDSDQQYDFNQIYLLFPFTNQVEKMVLKEKISQDSYFIGTLDGKAYLIDRKNKKEYEINPKKKEIIQIGDTSSNAKYYDGEKWSVRNIYDFLQQDTYFGTKISSKLKKKYASYQLYRGIGRTYLIKDNCVYYSSDAYPNKKVLLFSIDDMKEITVNENQLFFISHNTLYKYSIENGLRPILSTRELEFNAKNRYSVAFKN